MKNATPSERMRLALFTGAGWWSSNRVVDILMHVGDWNEPATMEPDAILYTPLLLRVDGEQRRGRRFLSV